MNTRSILKIKCKTCKGRGYSAELKTVPCDNCSAKGWVQLIDDIKVCDKCHGDSNVSVEAKTSCPHCDGRGFVPHVVEEISSITVKCEHCDGEAAFLYWMCPFCDRGLSAAYFEPDDSEVHCCMCDSVCKPAMVKCSECHGSGGECFREVRYVASDRVIELKRPILKRNRAIYREKYDDDDLLPDSMVEYPVDDLRGVIKLPEKSNDGILSQDSEVDEYWSGSDSLVDEHDHNESRSNELNE